MLGRIRRRGRGWEQLGTAEETKDEEQASLIAAPSRFQVARRSHICQERHPVGGVVRVSSDAGPSLAFGAEDARVEKVWSLSAAGIMACPSVSVMAGRTGMFQHVLGPLNKFGGFYFHRRAAVGALQRPQVLSVPGEPAGVKFLILAPKLVLRELSYEMVAVRRCCCRSVGVHVGKPGRECRWVGENGRCHEAVCMR